MSQYIRQIGTTWEEGIDLIRDVCTTDSALSWAALIRTYLFTIVHIFIAICRVSWCTRCRSSGKVFIGGHSHVFFYPHLILMSNCEIHSCCHFVVFVTIARVAENTPSPVVLQIVRGFEEVPVKPCQRFFWSQSLNFCWSRWLVLLVVDGNVSRSFRKGVVWDCSGFRFLSCPVRWSTTIKTVFRIIREGYCKIGSTEFIIHNSS